MRQFAGKITIIMLVALLLAFLTGGTLAQDDTTNTETDDLASALPAAYTLNGFTYHAQTWNNCGPATLTMALSYFGYADGQARAAAWLKPNYEDKNVSPWQMSEFVNTQVPEIPVYSYVRYGGTLDLLKTLIYNGFPVIIEAGYDPPRAAQGWMGHYLLMVGYDDTTQQFTTYDSYDGQNMVYSYDHIAEFWQHFNYTYIVLYDSSQQQDLDALLGDDADLDQNIRNALEIARNEAIADQTDNFAWFNMGTNLVMMGQYEDAATAFDVARTTGAGLPWRMLWYQFGPYEAYHEMGRYNDMIVLAQAALNDGGGQYVEETYYYGGLAREGLGETERAIANYQAAVNFNPNFTPARERLDALTGAAGG